MAAAGALVPTAGSVWTTNLVQLDNGTCGTNLQIGSDPTASSSATPSFWLMGDGGLSSYQISIDGVLLGTFNSDGYGNVCIYTTVPLPDGPHQLTGVEQAPHAGNLVTPSPFTFTVDTVPPSVPSTPLLASFSDSGIRGDNITQYRSISFTGTCDPNGSMQLYEGTLLLGGAKADSTGHWTASTTSLADGVHQIKALAVDEAGNRSAYSAATAVTVDTAPPSNNFTSPAAGATVSGSVNVASNASDGVSMWKVDFQLDGVTKQTDTSSPYTWTWDTTQTTNGQHTLTTIATDAAGNTTTASETVTVQNGSATVPGAPTLNSTTPANNQVALVWTAPTSNGGSAITNYKVYRGTSSGSETLLTTLGNVTTYTDTSAANGTTYYYKISAVNAVGEGSLSNELSATPATTPGAPTLNSATRGNNQVALAWSPPASNGGSPVTNYKVYRGTSSGGETLLTTLGNVTTYTDSSAANGTTYYYKLSAVNSAGEGTASNELSATPATTPGAPTLNSATPANNSVALVWSPPASNGGLPVTNYRLYRGTSSGGETLLTTLANVTSYTDTGLTNGTTYYYKISAVNAVGEGPLSNELSATPSSGATPPGAPTLNTATPGNNSVALTWTAPASDGGSPVTSYKVYRGTNSGGETLLTTLGNVTTYTDTSAANGTTYYYKISAVNSVGEGSLSNELSATPATTPGAPTLNSATPGNGQVSLAWTAPASNGGSPVTNYKIYRGTASGGETLLTTLANVTSYTDTGLTNGTTYYYKVSAVNAVGEGTLSNERSATPATVPGAPTLSSATSGNGQVALGWTPPVSNGGAAITNYKLYRGTSSGGETLLTTLANVTSYTDTGLTNGTTYYYKVSAVNSVGEGTASNELSATPATTPGAPTLTSANPGNNSVTLVWTPPASNGGSPVTNYKVYRGTSSGGETLLTTLGNVTGYIDSSALNGTTYYYKVSAVNSVGEGSASNELSATPATTPGAATLNSATPGNNSVALTWTAPASNGGSPVTNYKVYRGTSSGGETLLTTVGNVTTYTDSSAVNGTTYYYKVSAVNAVGEGALSNEKSAAPATTPGAPTLNSATPGNGQVALGWTPPASNGGSPVTNYKVYRGTSSGGETLLTTLANVTSYTDTGLTNGTTYYYKVSAVNSVGEGAASNELSATPATVPGAPTLNSATPGNNSVALIWTAPASNGGAAITNYKLYRGTSSGGETLLTTLGNVTTYTDTSAANGTTYYYKVSAVNSVGEGAASNELSATPTTSVTAPGAPTLNSASGGNGNVVLGWSPPADDGGAAITNYKVYRGTSSGGETLLTTLGNVTSYTDTTAVNGTTYYYEISAVNSVGESAVSNELSAKPASVPGAPTLTSATGNASSITLAWTAPANNGGAAITNYKVYRGTSSGTETFLTTVGNVTGYTDTTTVMGVTYYYEVSAVNSVGEGTMSNELSAADTPDSTPPSTPTNLKLAVAGTSQLAIYWTPSTDNISVSGYDVYRNGVKVATTAAPNFIDSGLAAGNSYTYKVIARDAAGNSSSASTSLRAKTASLSKSRMTGTISGVVYNAQGRPASNVIVQTTVNGLVRSTQTSSSGVYTFSSLNPGQYTISVTGAQPFTATVVARQTVLYVTTLGQ